MTELHMTVTVDELRRFSDALFRHLESKGVGSVALDQDYYWSIPSEHLYDPTTEPTKLEMGQLTEDLEELRQIERGERPPVSYGLVWLSSILRCIGEKYIS